MKTLKTVGIFIAIATVILLTCRNRGPRIITVDPIYSKWVSGFTGGTISRTGTVRIELAADFQSGKKNKAYTDSFLPDSNILKKLFSFEPELKGSTRWLSPRIIEFTPAEPLRSGQIYTVSLKLSKLVKVPAKYKKMAFQFRTMDQRLFVNAEGLKYYNEYHTKYQYLTGTFKTTDHFDTAAITSLLQARQNGKNLRFRYEYEQDENEFRYYFDSIERFASESKVELIWNGKKIQAEDAGSNSFTVAALGDFSIKNTFVKDNGEQEVHLHFSDPIFPEQDFGQFISIEGSKQKLEFSVDRNVISIYLQERLIGTKQITVQPGLKNSSKGSLLREQTALATFTSPNPQMRFHGSGSILPNSQGMRIPLETINLKAVDIRVIKIYQNNVHQFLQINDLDGEDGLSRVGKVILEKKIELNIHDSVTLQKWTRHILDLGQLIQTDLGSIYRVSIRFRASYTGCNCGGIEYQSGYNWNENANKEDTDGPIRDMYEEGLRPEIDNDGRYYSYDSYNEDGNRNPCSSEYYYGKALNRNILASDLGIIYKGDLLQNGYAFVSNLITAQPAGNTTVELYNYSRQLLASAVTDATGMAKLKLTERPFLLVAKNNDQRGYLKLNTSNLKSMSRFETDGEKVSNELDGLIYGERGVWRPGDSIFLTFLVDNKFKKLPENHPYTFEFSDPRGQVIETRSLTLKKGLMDVIRLRTSPSAITGNYTATATLGNLQVSQNIQVETIKPNRLKILMDIPEKGLEIHQKSDIKMGVKWLHGAVAPNLKTNVELSLKPQRNPFKKFKDYVFESPLRRSFHYRREIYDGNLDNNGNANIPLTWNDTRTAPGILSAALISRVYESNGNMNMDKTETNVYPFKGYVGLKTPGTRWGNTLSSGEKKWFDVVYVDKNGNYSGAQTLKISIYKIDWKWWYEQESEEDESNYLSRPATYLFKDTTIQAKNGKGGFYFGLKGSEWGRFLMVVSDPDGGHESGSIITFDYPYWDRQNGLENDGATLLTLSTDKATYQSGEPVQVTFPSAAGGRALVSIETSKQVVKTFWVNTTAKETRLTFTSHAEMSPNAYVHISLIQPHLQTVNDLPIRMYGVVPIVVENPGSHLKPVIACADIFKPEQFQNITVSESNGAPMYYTLAVVDEGLLDLTHFKTPDPHKAFYAKEALGVKTWDLYDAVIGAFGGKMDRLLSIGGDGSYDEENGSKANRFKPMVKHLGPFYLAAGSSRTHAIPIPNYIGSVRIMVVANHGITYGNSEKTVAVKQPLMVLSNFPRVLGPDERIKIPVSIFAMDKPIKDVQVRISMQGDAQVLGSSSKALSFSRTGEEMMYFEIKTNASIGVLKIQIHATGGGYTARDEVEIDVRNPNPVQYRNTDFTIKAGASVKVPIQWFGVKGSNGMHLQLASIPVYGMQNRLDYLIQYPHGCIEQTTSAVFAQLFLHKVMSLNPNQLRETETNIKAGIQRYLSFQTNDGGFSYWPGETDESNEWGTNYAGNFLLEAKKAGYAVPDQLMKNWLKFQQEKAQNWRSSNNLYVHSNGDESWSLIQAYRLYLLALADKPDIAAMNLLKQEGKLSNTVKWRLASAYALCGKKDIAKEMVQGLSWSVNEYKELGFNYGSTLRDKAMILESMSNMGMQTTSKTLFDHIVQNINNSTELNTQEAAYCLIGICTWAQMYNNPNLVSVTDSRGKNIAIADGKKSISLIALSENNYASGDYIVVKNNSKNPVYLRSVNRGSALKSTEKKEESGLGMNWYFTDINNKTISPDNIPLGTDFYAKIELTNTSDYVYHEMVLKEILASGWEIMDSRLFGDADYPARYANIRDDRAYFYFLLEPKKSKTFVLSLHASFEGEFYLPSPYAEAMYDHSIHCSNKGRKVRVVKSPETL